MRTRSLLLPALALALGCVMAAQPSPLSWPRTGEGSWTYAWQPGWMNLPDGVETGNTHGCVVLDSAGRVYLNTDSARAVMVFASDGTFLRAFGEDLASGLHGMEITGEGAEERLWLTHTGRHEVLQATLEGEILWRLPWPEESGLYGSAGEYKPTSVAVAPDGRFWVADGYGQSYSHRYDKAGNHLNSINGEEGQGGAFDNCHGIYVDRRRSEHELYIALRRNQHIQVYDLEGGYKRAFGSEFLSSPSGFVTHGDLMVVAELRARLAVLDKDDKLLCYLGENEEVCSVEGWPNNRNDNGELIPTSLLQTGKFNSPHGMAVDAQGNLYVAEWLIGGRFIKLEK